VGAELAAEAAGLKRVLRAALGWEYDLRFITGGGDSDGDGGGDDEDLPTFVEDPTHFDF